MPKSNKKNEGLLDSWGRRNRLIEDVNCKNCGKKFTPKNKRIKNCSKECGYACRDNKAILRRKKESWYTSPKGYIQGHVWIDDYTKVYVKQHRYIMENHLGRKLLSTEDVHHINGVRNDNRIENLQVIDHSEHTKITNQREYKKGYTMNLSDSERLRRSEQMKKMISKK